MSNPFACLRKEAKKKPEPETIGTDSGANATLLTPIGVGPGRFAPREFLIGKVWKHEALSATLFRQVAGSLGMKVLVRSYLLCNSESWYRAFTFFKDVEAARCWLKQPCWTGLELDWFGKSLIIGSDKQTT